MTNKSFFQKYGPPALARGLWGKGPVPLRYKMLFLGQSLIFTMALFIRTKDVDKAQQIRQAQMLSKLQDADKQRAEMRGEESSNTSSDVNR